MSFFPEITNDRIKIVIKPMTEFYNYKYKEDWIRNHEKNEELKEKTQWELNMLWSEKVWFVRDTIQKNYFHTEYYGWCDIGYFRNEYDNTPMCKLSHWANSYKISRLSKDHIHYSIVNNDVSFINELYCVIKDKNEFGLPKTEIPAEQTSVAGGFFILHKSWIYTWCYLYDEKLQLYFKHRYLVKDDQMIIIDCIVSNRQLFYLHREENYYDERCIIYDNWFMFQRILI
jgi:hypothetical protein